MVFSLDIALGGGFAIPVQGFARVKPGGESVAKSHLGSSIASLGLLFDRGDVAHAHGECAAQIVLGKDWMSEQQGEDRQRRSPVDSVHAKEGWRGGGSESNPKALAVAGQRKRQLPIALPALAARGLAAC